MSVGSISTKLNEIEAFFNEGKLKTCKGRIDELAPHIDNADPVTKATYDLFQANCKNLILAQENIANKSYYAAHALLEPVLAYFPQHNLTNKLNSQCLQEIAKVQLVTLNKLRSAFLNCDFKTATNVSNETKAWSVYCVNPNEIHWLFNAINNNWGYLYTALKMTKLDMQKDALPMLDNFLTHFPSCQLAKDIKEFAAKGLENYLLIESAYHNEDFERAYLLARQYLTKYCAYSKKAEFIITLCEEKFLNAVDLLFEQRKFAECQIELQKISELTSSYPSDLQVELETYKQDCFFFQECLAKGHQLMDKGDYSGAIAAIGPLLDELPELEEAKAIKKFCLEAIKEINAAFEKENLIVMAKEAFEAADFQNASPLASKIIRNETLYPAEVITEARNWLFQSDLKIQQLEEIRNAIKEANWEEAITKADIFLQAIPLHVEVEGLKNNATAALKAYNDFNEKINQGDTVSAYKKGTNYLKLDSTSSKAEQVNAFISKSTFSVSKFNISELI